jgi:hypothetical protein
MALSGPAHEASALNQFRVEPPPMPMNFAWSGPNWKTMVLFDITIARLRASDIMPSVTTNGGMPR